MLLGDASRWKGAAHLAWVIVYVALVQKPVVNFASDFLLLSLSWGVVPQLHNVPTELPTVQHVHNITLKVQHDKGGGGSLASRCPDGHHEFSIIQLVLMSVLNLHANLCVKA